MKVALIPCGVTEWRQKGRLLGRAELELTAKGETQCAAWGEQLRPLMLSKIFHAPDGLSRDTARQIGRRINVPTKALDALVEVDGEVERRAGAEEAEETRVLEGRLDRALRRLGRGAPAKK